MSQKLVTETSFINGVLVQPGYVVEVDDAKLNGNETNLADAPTERVAVVQMAAIAPTGPNPTAPQQIAPDTIQTAGGYVQPGAQIVGEVTQQADQRFAGELLDFAANDEDGPTDQGDLTAALAESQAENERLRTLLEAQRNQGNTDATLDDVRTADSGSGDSGEGSGEPAGDQPGDEFITGTVPEVKERLGGLTDEQLEQARAAENDRENARAGVISAIEAELERRKSA